MSDTGGVATCKQLKRLREDAASAHIRRTEMYYHKKKIKSFHDCMSKHIIKGTNKVSRS